MYRLRPVAEREFVFTNREIAEVMGYTWHGMVAIRKRYRPDFPKLPTTKHAVWNFMKRHKLTGRVGPKLHMSPLRREIVRIRQEEGLSCAKIGQRLGGMKKKAVEDHWYSYLKAIKLDPNYGKENDE